MTDVGPWPKLRAEDRWLAGLMEELLAADDLDAEELCVRARQLRDEVHERPADGDREAALALADRYEQHLDLFP